MLGIFNMSDLNLKQSLSVTWQGFGKSFNKNAFGQLKK
jgi:hypothetical protein